jgi:hypothetical protein
VIGDWGHFSATGHRRGGKMFEGARLSAAELAGVNLGGIMAYKKGGKTAKPKKRAPKPVLSSRQNSGIRRSVARGEGGIASYEDSIQRLERQYDQRDRVYGLSDEVLTTENDDGSVTVNTGAVRKRLGELFGLSTLRGHIRGVIQDYRARVHEPWSGPIRRPSTGSSER